MSNTFSAVKHILRSKLLIPVRRIRSRQLLTSEIGLSAFELNTLLYFIEEKYRVDLHTFQPSATLQELVDSIDNNLNSKIV